MVESECCVFRVSPTDPSAMAIRNVPPRLGVPAHACLATIDVPIAADIPRAVDPARNSRRFIAATSGAARLRPSVFSLMIASPSQVLDAEVSPTSDYLRWNESSDPAGGSGIGHESRGGFAYSTAAGAADARAIIDRRAGAEALDFGST